jgi:hypothetical protein
MQGKDDGSRTKHGGQGQRRKNVLVPSAYPRYRTIVSAGSLGNNCDCALWVTVLYEGQLSLVAPVKTRLFVARYGAERNVSGEGHLKEKIPPP